MRFETTSSVWIIDEDAMILTRIPKNESPNHSDIPYDELGAPEGFVRIKDYGSFFYIELESGRKITTGKVLVR